MLRTRFSVAEKPSVLQGGKRFFTAFCFGLLAAAAFPPLNLLPLLWLSFPGLVFLLRGCETKKAAFACGWSFAFSLLIVRLHWIAGALFVDFAAYWWVLPFAVAGLPAFFALYYGGATLIAYLWGIKRADGVLLFALAWTGAEMARAHLLTGMPWDILGYVWAACLPVLQSVSLFGIEGLTLLTILLALAPVFFLMPQSGRKGMLFALLGLCLFDGLALWGLSRLARAPEAFVDGVTLRLVQADQAQNLKWRADQRLRNFQNLLARTFEKSGNPTHIIWPETATAYYLAETPGARMRIAQEMPEGSILLTGVVRRAADGKGRLKYYNSLVAMDNKGTLIAGYDKHHLVPFGEYVPWSEFLPFDAIAGLGLDFSAGEGVRTLRAPSLPPFSPLVCYEAIFSGAVASNDDPPALLLNVTNDGWYEGTIGPAQHFLISRVRAIEEGVPLVRVANKGTTAVVDPWGRVVARAFEDTQSLDSPLPRAASELTLFGIYGRSIFWLTAGVFFALVLAVRRGKKSD